MTEPSVEFDFEAVASRLDGDKPETSDEAKRLVEHGARTVLASVLFNHHPRSRPNLIRWRKQATARVMIAAYLLRLPGHEKLLSLKHIAKLCDVNRLCAYALAKSISAQLGLNPKIRATHRKSSSRQGKLKA